MCLKRELQVKLEVVEVFAQKKRVERGGGEARNGNWGLRKKSYGVKLLLERKSKKITRKGKTQQ